MKKSEIMKAILYSLAAVGVVALAIALPNVGVAVHNFYQPLKKYKPDQVKRSLSYLHKRKLIGIGQEGDKTVIKITEKGRDRLLKFRLEDLQIKPMKKWDKKFRLVIFDIPEKFRYARQVFAAKLREIGFVLLQKSAWICPHQCLDEIEFLVGVYAIKPFVRVVTIDASELEFYWQKKFNLRS